MTSTGQKILLLVGAGIASMLIAEGALRLWGKALPASFFIADPELGWSLRPGAEGWSLGEQHIYIRINGDGMRDREHDIAKPAGVVRIAVLGDSYSEARSVELHQTFWAELERQVGRCRPNGRSAEVLNFGVSGYGTGQQLLQLKRVWKYDPDIVLLAFYPGNDVANNHPGLAPSFDPESRPYFHLVGGALVLDTSYRRLAPLQPDAIRGQRLRAALLEHVRLLQLIRHAASSLSVRSARAAAELVQMERKLLAPPTEPTMVDAWGVTEALIAQLDRHTAHRAEFWVAVVPMRPHVHPDPAIRHALASRLGRIDLDYAEQRIGALAERQGFQVVALGRHLAAFAERHGAFVNGGGNIGRGDGHWNALGHRLAGEHIADHLCAKSERLGRPPHASAGGGAAARQTPPSTTR